MGITISNRDHLKVAGHKGTWYVLSESCHPQTGEKIYLLEHETYGEDAAAVIVKRDLTIVLEDVLNGFSDLE